MRRRRWGGLVGSGRAAPAGVEVVLAGAGARAAPTAAPGRRGWVRVRVRLRGRVREAGSTVAIELQGGGVAAADLGREVTVVVSGIDGLARRRRCSRRRCGRRLVLGVQRVHEVRTHRDEGGRAGDAEPAGSAPPLGHTAAGASGAAARAAGAAGLRRCCRSPARPPHARRLGGPAARAAGLLGAHARLPRRRLGLAPPPSWVAGPRPAPARRCPLASPGARRLGRNIIPAAPGDLPRCLHCFLSGTRRP